MNYQLIIVSFLRHRPLDLESHRQHHTLPPTLARLNAFIYLSSDWQYRTASLLRPPVQSDIWFELFVKSHAPVTILPPWLNSIYECLFLFPTKFPSLSPPQNLSWNFLMNTGFDLSICSVMLNTEFLTSHNFSFLFP